MGKKQIACKALEYLLEKGANIIQVVTKPTSDLERMAQKYNISLSSDTELYKQINKSKKDKNSSLNDLDLVVSYLFWKKIKKPLIELPKLGCINFHPAPLPEFGGFAPYSFGICEESPYWGVSAHFVNESFDAGDIIKVNKFDINPEKETAFSLEQKSQEYLFGLFKEVIDKVYSGEKLPRIPNKGMRYNSKEDFEKLRKIQAGDNAEAIEKKIRAFWYPPYDGASIELQGKEFTLVNGDLLSKIGKKYSD